MDTGRLSMFAAMAVTPLILHWVLGAASRQRAQVESGVVWFPASSAYRWFLYGGAGFFAAGAALSYGAGEPWVIWLFVGFAALCACCVPAPISLSSKRIEHHGFFGFFKRSWRWDEVDHAVILTDNVHANIMGADVRVIPKTGTKVIKHTSFHIDRKRFIFELKKRSIKVHDGRATRRL